MSSQDTYNFIGNNRETSGGGENALRVYQGDCLEYLKSLDADVFDSVITDPPYNLSFMGHSWDSLGRQQFQSWCYRWGAEVLRVLKPGGYALVFGGTRTYHRLTSGLEDAGFEIRDSIMWVYGSGFPKSLDISKAIDKQAGAEREAVGPRIRLGDKKPYDWNEVSGVSLGAPSEQRAPITAPATDAAKQWEGWGTALKPAYEPIVVARKPLAAKHTVAANVLEFGTGGINIDGCRVGEAKATEGRWPPNLLLAHSPDCVPTGEVRTVKTSKPAVFHKAAAENNGNTSAAYGKESRPEGYVTPGYGGDSGTETLEAWDCAPGCPVAEMDRQSGQSVSRKQPKTERKGGRATNFAMSTSGRTHDDAGGASRFFPVFLYHAKAGRSERPVVDGIKHPTVKPLELIRWLARLVTPAGGSVLDPFAGSGTTIEAAELEGFSCLGIEREPEYVRLVLQRMSKYEKEAA